MPLKTSLRMQSFGSCASPASFCCLRTSSCSNMAVPAAAVRSCRLAAEHADAQPM